MLFYWISSKLFVSLGAKYVPLWRRCFRCNFTRALFLTTCATNVLCLVLLFGMAFLCMFLLHFNDEYHHMVTMTIASFTPMLSILKDAPPGTYPSSHQHKKKGNIRVALLPLRVLLFCFCLQFAVGLLHVSMTAMRLHQLLFCAFALQHLDVTLCPRHVSLSLCKSMDARLELILAASRETRTGVVD